MPKPLSPTIEVDTIDIRPAQLNDAAQLYALEIKTFSTDQLSLRRFKHWIKAENRVLLVATYNKQLLGYGLVILLRGTRLARLYSIAVDESARGQGISTLLANALEEGASEQGRIFMRLEVAKDNDAAINLYTKLGYKSFGTYEDYYGEDKDALRMQKRIRHLSEKSIRHPIPWYRQTTEFTCGPASLMMALASFDSKEFLFSQELELDIWREATTIFMTSGHGGCHPIGLGLAARRRGFNATVYLNKETPLFVDSVRSSHKKDIIATVDNHFKHQAEEEGVDLIFEDISQNAIESWIDKGGVVLILISTYRIDGKKAPHWVCISGWDDKCLYVHDPDPDGDEESSMDCQHLPIARNDFDKMSVFGVDRLRTAVVVYPEEKN